MRNCGNCRWFVKWKSDLIGGGLCEVKDRRTKTDRGRKCKEHKAMKYKRDSKSPSIPPPADYSDEVTSEQLEALKEMVSKGRSDEK